jgi:putative endonuclease
MSSGGAKYTRGRTPVTLVYTEDYFSRSEAQKREAEIKALSREEKERLISESK